MWKGTKAWNNTVPFRSGEKFGIAGLILGFLFLCLNEWQLHPSSWVKAAIYKSFSNFFFSLASWPNFLLPLILPFLPFGSIYSSPSLPPPQPPWSVLLHLHLDRGKSCLTRMPDPPHPCQSILFTAARVSFQNYKSDDNVMSSSSQTFNLSDSL